MQKLFLVALIVSVCMPAIMAQEPAKAGIYRAYPNLRFESPDTSKQDANIQNYLFGVQVKDNSIDGPRLRPFGHFLAGVSRQKQEFDTPQLIPVIGDDELSFRRTSFAMAMGGGIDVRLTDNFSVRAIKLDYLPIFIDDFQSQGVIFDGRTQNNFRAGAGVVFQF